MSPPTRPKHEASRAQRLEAMRVWLLGDFRVSIGSRTVGGDAWRLKKAAALVKLLALAPSHRLHREQIMDLLWPDDSERKAASNNLRKTLHAARRTLDPAAGSRYLASEGESLVLCPAGELWVDVDAFEEAAATARRSRDPAAYRAAIEFYAGDLLPEDLYEEWAEGGRGELRRLYLDLLVELAALYEERWQYGPAVEVLRKAITEEPTNEDAHSSLMRLYALLGRRADTVDQFERLKKALSTHLGAEPSEETLRLRGELAAGTFPPTRARPSETPAEQSQYDARHNLPAPRDSFVGRERELREAKRELAMTRLLTLTGPGGSGKTRLVLEVARDLIGAYPDGVWLVELAGLSEPELVSQAVASTLGIPERPDQPLIATLVDVLHAKQSLLVLDNCEHLVEAAARFVDALLDGCPRLRILATSREPLDVLGETIYPVSPLSVPNLQRLPTVEELESYEAARLFAERAAEKRRGFALVPANAGTVAEICRRLDGLPLAMELAAARVGTLSVDQISDRLGDSLGLLTGGARTAAPRQRTLKGTLDWSFNLLSEPERKVLRRLSVFAGGWRLEAAEVVASDKEIEEEKVLDVLAELVEKSLVVVETPAEGEVRYRMLEPVRQYALEKLRTSGEAEVVSRQHFAYFLEFSEEIASKLTGPQQGPYFRQLEAEHNNLRLALSWALEREEAELELQLSGMLWWFWLWRGHYAEGRTWLEAGLAKDKAMTASVRAKALYGLGRIATMQGDYELALASQAESISLYRAVGNESGIARCLGDLGWLAWLRSDFLQATALLEESLARLQEFGHEGDVAFVLTRLAHVAFSDEDHARATALLEESLTLYRKEKDSTGIAICVGLLGWSALLRGDYRGATGLLEEAIAELQWVGLEVEVYFPITLGLAEMLKGELQQAKENIGKGLILSRKLSDRMGAVWGLEGMAMIATSQRKLERAAKLWGSAEALREAIGAPLRPDERSLYAPYMTAVRVELDGGAWEEGRKMTLEEVVEYAFSERGHDPAASLTQQPLRGGQRATVLTPREGEIADLVARGLTNRQVASELSISEHTVATHVARILRKLRLSSRSQLSAWVSERAFPSSGFG